MKELSSISSNISFIETENPPGIYPMVELILLVSEPAWASDDTGEFFKRRVIESLRFSTNAKNLRALSKQILDLADKADEAMDRVLAGNVKASRKRPSNSEPPSPAPTEQKP